jgi:hypothetical protein
MAIDFQPINSGTELLVRKYFPPDAVDTAMKVAKAESNENPNAVNVNKNKTKDHGLFQINDVNIPKLKEAGIISSPKDLYNPDKNAKAAAFLHSQEGFKPWSSSESKWSQGQKIDFQPIDFKEEIKPKPSLTKNPVDWITNRIQSSVGNLAKQNEAIARGEVKPAMERALGFAPLSMGIKPAIGATEPILQSAGKSLFSALGLSPERMYERVAKFSTTLKPEERLRRVQTALREGLPLTQAGVEKSKNTISELNQKISQLIQPIRNEPLDITGAIGRAEQKIGRQAIQKTKPFFEEPLEQIVETAGKAKEGASVFPQTLGEAHQMKVNINRELDDFYKAFNSSPDKTSQLSKLWVPKTKSAIADEVRIEMYARHPELGNLTGREASLIQLNKSYERAVNRISNRDLWSLKSIVSTLIHPSKWKFAFMEYIINNPEVQSNLAIALNKAKMQGSRRFPSTRQAFQEAAAKISPKPTEKQSNKEVVE